MKANNFPDRIYLPRDVEYPQVPDIWWEREASEDNVEYVKVSFISKWLEENITSYIKVGNKIETYEGFDMKQFCKDLKGIL